MNDIGISSALDWPRIKHLYKIGIFGALLNLAGDMLLGAHAAEEGLSGLEMQLSAFVQTSDRGLFWSALLGLLGVTLEGLSYFAVYRLMAGRAPRYAHAYRAGIFGYLIAGPCGFHVPVLAGVYFYKRLCVYDAQAALGTVETYMLYFMAPALCIFAISFLVLIAVQAAAFAKGLTPYPKWCAVFSLLFAVVPQLIAAPFDTVPLANGLATAWISVGNLWMFGGLLAMAKKAGEKACRSNTQQ